MDDSENVAEKCNIGKLPRSVAKQVLNTIENQMQGFEHGFEMPNRVANKISKRRLTLKTIDENESDVATVSKKRKKMNNENNNGKPPIKVHKRNQKHRVKNTSKVAPRIGAAANTTLPPSLNEIETPSPFPTDMNPGEDCGNIFASFVPRNENENQEILIIPIDDNLTVGDENYVAWGPKNFQSITTKLFEHFLYVGKSDDNKRVEFRCSHCIDSNSAIIWCMDRNNSNLKSHMQRVFIFIFYFSFSTIYHFFTRTMSKGWQADKQNVKRKKTI